MARAPSATVKRIRKTTNNDSFLEQIFTHLRSAGEGEGDGQGGHGEVFAQLQFCAACMNIGKTPHHTQKGYTPYARVRATPHTLVRRSYTHSDGTRGGGGAGVGREHGGGGASEGARLWCGGEVDLYGRQAGRPLPHIVHGKPHFQKRDAVMPSGLLLALALALMARMRYHV